MSDSFDVVVIGAGPAGYPAAIRAAQNKMRVACVDEWKNLDGSHTLGGTCLNAGCIPSKALLESSELYHRARSEFAEHGIQVGHLKLDLAAMQSRRAQVVKTMTGGIAALFKANGVEAVQGHGKVLGPNRVEVTRGETKRLLQACYIVLAPGSVPIELPHLAFDGKYIVDSWRALELDAVPRRLGVIGAGVIGLELGSVWRRLGSEVTVLEALEQLLPAADAAIAKEAQRQFKKQGIEVKLGAKVSAAQVKGNEVLVTYSDGNGQGSLVVDRLIVAVGRKPLTRDLLTPESGVRTDARGFIEVDAHCQTTAQGVWAVGDAVRGPMLAHKGKEEGIMVADRIAGLFGEVNYGAIPSVVYTAPEIAWVGQSEEQVKASGRAYKVGSFPFSASGRARAMDMPAGFVKVISAADDDEILGVHIIGPLAGELIAEAVLAMEYSASTEDLQRTMHAHPTLSEAVHEAALSVDKRAIDAINR